MFGEELDVACLELHNGIAKDLGVLKYVEIKGTIHVSSLVLVPFEGHDSKLESVHACAVVAQFLIAVFDLVKAINLVFVADIEAWEFSVNAYEVGCFNWIQDERQLLGEILVHDIHIQRSK